MREVVLDTETTGLDPRDGHRVVEIGCVELVNHVATGEVFHVYINPERDMPAEAFEIHGLSDAFLADKPKFGDIARPFLDFVEGATLVIHNAAFDMKFLNAELTHTDLDRISHDQVLDTLDIARRKHPTASNSLDALCRRYGVDNSGRTKHGALLDSELLAEVYLELIGGRQPNLVLVGSEQETDAKGVLAAKPVPPRPQPLASRLTAEEERGHRELVDEIGETAIWHRYI
ncbi:MAG: DNA polymerase III subunit epsilon [Hyphomicrobiales bacterium]